MGYSKWSNAAYLSTSQIYDGASMDEIFTNNKLRKISPQMSPLNIKLRESLDSDSHPNSYSAITFLDVTGSMGSIPKKIVQEKLGSIMNTLVDSNFPDIQILFGAIGDHKVDSFPLQIGQFENGAEELNRWLVESYIEGGGGGGNHESYLLAWYFASRFTTIDCFNKRNKKGIVITVGDERSHPKISGNSLKKIFGEKDNIPQEITDIELIKEVKERYEPFHIHVNTTGYKNNQETFSYWQNLLGKNFVVLNDDSLVAETISAIIGTYNSIPIETITRGFSESTKNIVLQAIENIEKNVQDFEENPISSLII